MSMRRRAVAGAVLVATLIGGASLAWACTRTTTVTLSPSFGRPGSQTQVSGRGFVTPAGGVGEPVEIRWNSTSGPVLGRAVGPNFSVTVTIPEAGDGVYYLLAIGTSARSQASFQVRTTTSGSPEAEPTGEGQTSNVATGSEAAPSSRSGSTASGTEGTSQSTTGEQPAASTAGTGAQSVTAPAGQASPSPVPAEQASAAQNAAGSARSAGQPATVGERSEAAKGSAISASAGTPTPAPEREEEVAPSPRSATADLYSGFASGHVGSLTAPGIDGSPSGGTSPLAVGVGLLTVGLIALGLGFGAAELARRRALVHTEA